MKNLAYVVVFVLLTGVVSCNKTEKNAETATISQTQPKQEKAQNINSPEAKELLAGEEEVVILDVRTPAEFSGGHLQEAINLDYNAPGFAEELNKLDPTKKYLVYCAVGGRSAKAVALMQEKGFAQVYNCEEGFDSLKKEGVPTE